MSERRAKLERRQVRKAVNESWGQIVKPQPWWMPTPVWWWLINLLLNVKRPTS